MLACSASYSWFKILSSFLPFLECVVSNSSVFSILFSLFRVHIEYSIYPLQLSFILLFIIHLEFRLCFMSQVSLLHVLHGSQCQSVVGVLLPDACSSFTLSCCTPSYVLPKLDYLFIHCALQCSDHTLPKIGLLFAMQSRRGRGDGTEQRRTEQSRTELNVYCRQFRDPVDALLGAQPPQGFLVTSSAQWKVICGNT